jgi:hypothetical protein
MKGKPRLKGKAAAKIEASAKVSIQRKKSITEVIPPDVTRAKAARWLDLISPITEWAGLKGDMLRHQREQLRVQQEQSLDELGRRVGQKMAGRPPNHKLPPKIFVPALEAASLEDADSPLIEWWAGLLVSGAVSGHSRPIFTDIIKSIGPTEVAFLEKVWSAASNNPEKEYLDIFRYHANFDLVMNSAISFYERKAISAANWFGPDPKSHGFLDEILAYFETHACPGTGSIFFDQPDDGGARNLISISKSLWYDQPVAFHRKDSVVQIGRVVESSLDICISLSLLRPVSGSKSIKLPSVRNARLMFSGYQLTNLGVEFLAAVHPITEQTWSPAL